MDLPILRSVEIVDITHMSEEEVITIFETKSANEGDEHLCIFSKRAIEAEIDSAPNGSSVLRLAISIEDEEELQGFLEHVAVLASCYYDLTIQVANKHDAPLEVLLPDNVLSVHQG